IVVVAKTRGLYAGLSLQGSLLSSRTDFNRAYYGRELAARQIVMDMQASNPGADPLREVLARYGTSQGIAQLTPAISPRPAYTQPGGYSPPGPPNSPSSAQAPVTQQSLPPPRR
ncbi:MAG: hypothetical protein JO212_07635, partial [Acetobacteraceae bacterium]|nr:hypothetical protein [Acetobacteraceae bacterium]